MATSLPRPGGRWALDEEPATHPPPRRHSPWSWRIGRLAGIDIYVHATFVLLLAWVGMSHLLRGNGAAEAAGGVLLVMAVFGIIVIHEMAHALVARRFGIGTREITLLPIGGISRLERMPEEPGQELLVAIAGPAVNIVIAAVLLAFLLVARVPLDGSELRVVGGPFLVKLMWINVGLAVFNLLPAFPMDGGRVLRALLAMKLSYLKATETAAVVGQAFALLFALVGLFFNPFLVLVALFIWMGANAESALAHVRFSLEGVSAGQAMITQFRVLDPDETVNHALAHVTVGFQHDFPVVQGERPVGVLTRGSVLRAVANGALTARVGDLMEPDFAVSDVSEPLSRTLLKLNESDCKTVLVLAGETLVGILTQERLGEVVVLRESERRHQHA